MDPKSINEILADDAQFKNVEIDKVDANTTYIGFAKPTGEQILTSDPIFVIIKITKSGTSKSIRLANNLDNFTLVWDSHTTYTY